MKQPTYKSIVNTLNHRQFQKKTANYAENNITVAFELMLSISEDFRFGHMSGFSAFFDLL